MDDKRLILNVRVSSGSQSEDSVFFQGRGSEMIDFLYTG